MRELNGATAIVTGGGSGIGRASAMALARAGTGIVVADRDGDRAEDVAAAIVEGGGKALAAPFDVAAHDFKDLKDRALDRFGRIDIVMNNVGVMTNGLPENLPIDEWRRIIEIDLLSVVKSNIAFLPLLLAQGHGHIVNTASFAGLYTYAFDRMPYAACKAAIVQISEGLALYLRPRGIGVTLLCPGPVLTDIGASVRSFGPPTPVRTPGAQFAPLQPESVGDLVVDAIRANRFMVPTHEPVRDLLIERARDWDAFIQKQIDHPTIATPGHPVAAIGDDSQQDIS